MSSKKRGPTTRSNEAVTIEMFQRDPQFAVMYLNAILADGDQEELMVTLRRMSEAFGGVTQVAAAAELNATTLYRTLSPQGNPEFRSLTALLKAMGMRLAVQPIGKVRSKPAKRKTRASHAAERKGLS